MAFDLWQAFNAGQQFVQTKQQQAMDNARNDALLAIQNRKLQEDIQNATWNRDYQNRVLENNQYFQNREFEEKQREFNTTTFAPRDAIIAYNKATNSNVDPDSQITNAELNLMINMYMTKIQKELNASQIQANISQANANKAYTQALTNKTNLETQLRAQADATNKELGWFHDLLNGLGALGSNVIEDNREGTSFSNILRFIDPDAATDYETKLIDNRTMINGTLATIKLLQQGLTGNLDKTKFGHLSSAILGNDPMTRLAIKNLNESANTILKHPNDYNLTDNERWMLQQFTNMVQNVSDPSQMTPEQLKQIQVLSQAAKNTKQ